jgi:Flp pilus assembly protein TadB
MGNSCTTHSSSIVTLYCPDWAVCPPSRSLKCHLNVESALALFILTSDLTKQKQNKTRHKQNNTTNGQQQQKHPFLGMEVSSSIEQTDRQQTDKTKTRNTQTDYNACLFPMVVVVVMMDVGVLIMVGIVVVVALIVMALVVVICVGYSVFYVFSS